jgi:serine/threonine protein kinase
LRIRLTTFAVLAELRFITDYQRYTRRKGYFYPMLLAAGIRVGPYEIKEPLGEGGMGEVYRAHDPRLKRDVAIKVLRPEVADRRRFEFEARAAGGLNHPNILAIFDIGEENGAPYIVSELLEGESLREVVTRGAVPTRRLLDISVQIAAGLSAAHAQGLVHRDLKPENVMVLRDGQVRILDFGLAKQAPGTAEKDVTRTLAGPLSGTLAYMSPEQLQGGAVDFRSDQFSLGIILYELATGHHPFEREDRIATMSAIVREEPAPVITLNPLVPAPLRWLIERCLAKEPNQRYTSTWDLCQQLHDIRDHISEVFSPDAATQIGPLAHRALRLPFSVVAVLIAVSALAGAATGAWFLWRRASAFAYHFTPFATDAADETEPAWSPDGQTLAYTSTVNGVSQVFARRLDSAVPAQITKSGSPCRYPFWSPDSSRLLYWSVSSLWSVSAVGGDAVLVLPEIPFGSPPAAVSPDGQVLAYFHAERGLNVVRLKRMADGNTKTYERAPFPVQFRNNGGIRFSPDGRKLLVWVVPDVDRGAELWVIPYPEGMPHRVVSDLLTGYRALGASWLSDNRRAAVATEANPGSGVHIFLVDTETGVATPVTSGTGEEREPAVAPDRDRMAFASGGADTDVVDVALDGSWMKPLVATSRHEYSSDWSPTGNQFIYVSDASGSPEIWLKSFSEGWARPVVERSPAGHLAYSYPRFSPDGQRIAYVRVGNGHLVWISSLSGGQAIPLEQESRDQHGPVWSPDGKWIAYTRYLGDRWEIAKASPGGSSRPVRIAIRGGATSPLAWSPDGNWIGFGEGEDVFLVSPDGGEPALLYHGASTFMFSRDGSRVYIIHRGPDRNWELVPLTVPNGSAGRPVRLPLPSEASINAPRLHPDGTHFMLSVGAWKRDIWILDGLQRRGLLPLLGLRHVADEHEPQAR